jgi:glucose/mannose-6-phosphate isomerase
MMVDLDSSRTYKEAGIAEILDHLRQFPEQCERAWEKALKFELPPVYEGIDKIIVLGMGGSAIGGEIARHLVLSESKVPVWVHRDYDLPLILNDATLVIASSYSGNTEETLSAFTRALETPAKKIAITAGGRLKQLAEKNDIPLFIIDYQAPPRMSFPHSFIPLVGIFQKLGLLGDKSADIKETFGILRGLRDDYIETNTLVSNPAKQLAVRLWGHIVVVYGGGMLSAVAQRWKTQFNENGKSWAFFEVFPELSHNAVVGYKFPSEVREKIFVILLRSSLLHPRSQLHYEAVAELLAREGIKHESVAAKGESALAQIMSLVLLGDYLSCYLAVLNGTDPSSIDAIDFVKGYLARFTS